MLGRMAAYVQQGGQEKTVDRRWSTASQRHAWTMECVQTNWLASSVTVLAQGTTDSDVIRTLTTVWLAWLVRTRAHVLTQLAALFVSVVTLGLQVNTLEFCHFVILWKADVPTISLNNIYCVQHCKYNSYYYYIGCKGHITDPWGIPPCTF